MYAVSLVGLFGAACGLLFAMCHSHKIGSCDVVGYMVVIVFFIVIALCIGLSLAISRQFDRIERAPMTTQLLRDADAAGNFNDTSNHPPYIRSNASLESSR
uniref:Transmembrane protein n=1 Tax=Chrysotila carterae TaxID=13221 RepID=A0A7S4FAL5_CHRCT